MSRFHGLWIDVSTIANTSFICGYCGESISSDKGYNARVGTTAHPFIYICHACNKPTFIAEGKNTPSAALGNPVLRLPDDISKIYEEIRSATSVNSYTAAVLAARKLLMHIAVEKGAAENKNFVDYVNYLETNHYTPPNSTSWVDRIRQLGNEANHDIVIMTKEQALLILTFLEMLLKFIYEFPDPPQIVQATQESNVTAPDPAA
jgi:hypothetical protein